MRICPKMQPDANHPKPQAKASQICRQLHEKRPQSLIRIAAVLRLPTAVTTSLRKMARERLDHDIS